MSALYRRLHVIVGWACDSQDVDVFAFAWRNGVLTNLGTVSGDLRTTVSDLILVRLEEKPERRQFEIAAHGLGRASS